MVRIILFETLLIVVSIYAFARGGPPERWTAAVFLVGASISLGIGVPPDRYRSLDVNQFTIDLVFLGIVGAIAVRANRFWPLWFAALHLLSIGIHLVRAYDPAILPVVYGQAVGKVAWPMCLALAWGTWNFRQRWAAQGSAPEPWSRFRW